MIFSTSILRVLTQMGKGIKKNRFDGMFQRLSALVALPKYSNLKVFWKHHVGAYELYPLWTPIFIKP